MSNAAEVYERVTAEVIKAIESDGVGNWTKPWVSRGGLPSNAKTGNAYSGGNILMLWIMAEINGYGSSKWATFNQWKDLGAQVKKGEKSTALVRWNVSKCKGTPKDHKCEKCGKLFPVGFAVFNSEQVTGWTPPAEPDGLDDAERLALAEAFFAAIGADVRHGGDRAFYARVGDYIGMPTFAQFATAADYYSTLAHEHTHWTGAEARLNRTFGKAFGDDAYSAEELVAELGAAFLCAMLGISNTPREDHAQYLSHWLKILRADSRAIFEAAGKASKAIDLLVTMSGVALAA